ncbi:class I SAM-dependent DNA methyltransferase [Virgibacillus sp. DJP39]|uniref:class I SAM-dependent DNA methyltransferase n=1 Tax=Virgibacillus sp. DJP39 TaxID=3409790 RepID=UPI003BB7F44E
MGREFIKLFEDWADSYDSSVSGEDPQYAAVFQHYDKILDEVARYSSGNVMEFGVGTGNLTLKLLKNSEKVFGIEPSSAMRKIAAEKLPELSLYEGDFLSFPRFDDKMDTVVSTYAFHHLTDTEKDKAISGFTKLLTDKGKVVFADTMFESVVAKEAIITAAEEKGYKDLVEDLNREYYPYISTLQELFEKNDFHVSFKRMNTFVWLVIAKKNRGV